MSSTVLDSYQVPEDRDPQESAKLEASAREMGLPPGRRETLITVVAVEDVDGRPLGIEEIESAVLTNCPTPPRDALDDSPLSDTL